jgi:hypothetical protein
MTFDRRDSLNDWRYAPYRTLRGALQRGRGTAAARLRDRPDQAQLVYECTSRDTRWDRQVDDRYTYLARLLRELRLDPSPLVTQLRACGPYRPWPQPDPTDGDRFALAVGILEALARAGDAQARESLRSYVGDGERWIGALETLAYQWPVVWWDDLWEIAAARLSTDDAAQLLPDGEPWRRWRGRDPRLDALLAAAERPAVRLCPAELAAVPDADLAAALRAVLTGRVRPASVLREIRRRGRPVPELLDIVEHLAPARPPGLFGALRTLGPLVAPAARRWGADPDHPLFADAAHLLAEHGDEQDIPVLLAALDRLADKWCGYDSLTEGLARILTHAPPATHADTRTSLVGKLRWLTMASPHSYERTSHLRSLLLLDRQQTTGNLPIHLLDCEPGVRLQAAQHTPLTDDARHWLAELRDDPIEEEEVRNAASERLDPT